MRRVRKEKYDFSAAARGAANPASKGTNRITIHLDDEVVDWFKNQVHEAGGGNYQTLINLALHEHIKRSNDPL